MKPVLSAYLDLVRYLAAMTVFVGHAAGQQWTGGIFWQVGGYGQTAVIVFFVLSGFVIAHVTQARECGVAEYAASRLSRLWSMVLPALAMTLVIDQVGLRVAPELYMGRGWYHGDDPLLRYAASALFVHDFWNYGLVPGVNGPFWSISYEAAYYLIFCCAVLIKPRWLGLVLAALSAALAGPTIVAMFPIWLLGLVAHQLSLGRPMPAPLGWALFTGSLATLFMSPEIRDATRHLALPFVIRGSIVGDFVDAAAFFVSIVAFIAVAPTFEAALLRFRPVIAYLATTSFALYLFHRPLLQMFTYLSPVPADSLVRRVVIFVGIPVVVALLTPATEQLKRGMKVHLLRIFRWQQTRTLPSAG